MLLLFLSCGNYRVIPPLFRWPEYYELVEHPIDFDSIERKLSEGQYDNPTSFDYDVRLLLRNSAVAYKEGKAKEKTNLTELRKLYINCKADCIDQLRDALGFNLTDEFLDDVTDAIAPTTEISPPKNLDTVSVIQLIFNSYDILTFMGYSEQKFK